MALVSRSIMAQSEQKSAFSVNGAVTAMSDREAIIEANQAFESLDLEKMEPIWLRDSKIVCIHPGWRKLTGWGPIMNSWERIFDGVFEMKFELRDLHLLVSGDMAAVVTEE